MAFSFYELLWAGNEWGVEGVEVIAKVSTGEQSHVDDAEPQQYVFSYALEKALMLLLLLPKELLDQVRRWPSLLLSSGLVQAPLLLALRRSATQVMRLLL
jgi:hypothetical protein